MKTEITAWHTGNAGIVIREHDTEKNQSVAVGFDVFARDPNGFYQDTPDRVREQLLEEIETGAIEMLVFTHEHGDHFCLADTLEALRRNPALRILSTEAVIRQIREREPQAGRLTAIRASEQKYRVADLGAVSLTVFNSVHMGDQFTDIQNLVCLLEAGGRHILLPGDARPDSQLYRRAAAWSEDIDWLIGPFPLLGLPSSRRLIRQNLKLGHVLAVHLPRPEKDAEGWRRNAEHICRTAEDGLPVPVFGYEPGKQYRL